jgi:hypothetical protein
MPAGPLAPPRFVLLEHDHPERHWDLMLEVGEVLWTWRLPEPLPPRQPTIPATRIGDHRLLYLDYEGPVSGQRGTVKREDAGTFTPLELRPDHVHVRLHGGRATGEVILRAVRPGDEWELAWLGT